MSYASDPQQRICQQQATSRVAADSVVVRSAFRRDLPVLEPCGALGNELKPRQEAQRQQLPVVHASGVSSFVIESQSESLLAQTSRFQKIPGDKDHRVQETGEGNMEAIREKDHWDPGTAHSGILTGKPARMNESQRSNNDSQASGRRGSKPEKHRRGQQDADPAHTLCCNARFVPNILRNTNDACKKECRQYRAHLEQIQRAFSLPRGHRLQQPQNTPGIQSQ